MKKYTFILFALLFSSVTFVSCSSDDDDNGGDPNGGTANLQIELTDAPGDFDEVWIEVVDVQVKLDDLDDDNTEDTDSIDDDEWISLDGVSPETYDLLTLTGGTTALLADAEIPAGELEEIRLVLGSGNSVVVDGVEYSLKTPSAQQSGLKIKIDDDLEAGVDYVYVLDFDVDQSVVSTSEGNYNLKPVIRASTQEAGAISGLVHPTDQQTHVTATNGNVTVSAYTNADGQFVLHGLPAGTYQVTVDPDEASGLPTEVLNNIEVVQGETTELETVFLNGEGEETSEES